MKSVHSFAMMDRMMCMRSMCMAFRAYGSSCTVS